MMLTLAVGLLAGCGGEDERAPKPPPPLTFGIEFAEIPRSFHVTAPVRVAGIEVGTAYKTERDLMDTIVWVRIRTVPRSTIHSDATAKLRPQIFKRGEWFIDLYPGSRRQPVLSGGQNIAGLKSP